MEENSKKSKVLSIIGTILAIPAFAVALMCLIELISMIIEGNNLGLAIYVLMLIIYVIPAGIVALVSVILNVIAYKTSTRLKGFKLAMMIFSLIALIMVIGIFVTWIVIAKFS